MSAQPPRSDGGAATATADRPFGLPRWVTAVLPLVVLAVLVGWFVFASPLAGVQSGQPLPDVTVTHATMPDDETVVLHVTNNGPDPVTISQVLVNEAYWDFRVEGAGGDRTIEPLGSARVVVPYHWTPGWDLEVALLLPEGATFHHTIVAPSPTPELGLDLLSTLAVVGLFVGVIPVALGMLWFPYIRSMSARGLHAVLLFAAGLLAFLAVDAGFEAIEVAEAIPGAYEGLALITLAALGTFLLVSAASSWGGDGEESRTGYRVAALVALGIGLHNLAEGLAIGSAFALGRVSLGAFLVIGFMLHNVTEGPAVVAPLARDGDAARPSLARFVALGLLAGAPVILGGWLGGLAYSPTLGAFFLAVGVGAILQVDREMFRIVREGGGRVSSTTNLLAFLAGFAVMYATDLFVAL